MNDEINEHLGQGIVYEARLPLAWKVLTVKPDEPQLAVINENNEAILRTISSLEDFAPDHTEDLSGLNQEIARIDVKLNLLLDLVGQLLAAQSTIPSNMVVRLGAVAVEWSGTNLPGVGQYVQIELYLHRSYPRPLCLLGSVRAGQLGESSVIVPFEGIGEPVQDALERLIFRHHRRRIAQARRPRS